MTSLLSRLQSEGPSRELDAEIALANGWMQERDSFVGDCWKSPQGRWQAAPPRYTDDIEAVRRDLLPKDVFWDVGFYAKGFRAEIWTSEVYAGESKATPAIALLIAIEEAKEERKP
jgi:hypothetical protein